MDRREAQKELLRAENKYVSRLVSIMDTAITEIDLTDHHSIDIAGELKRRLVYKQVRRLNEEIYRLGVQHAVEAIKRKTKSAGFVGAQEEFYTEVDDYLLAELTEHVIESLGAIGDDLKLIIESTLLEGYRLGESIPQLADRLQVVWDENRNRAVMYARTITIEIYNQAALNRYKESGVVDGIQYLAAIDDRTSEICRMLHETIWVLDDPQLKYPPQHYRCRSSIAPYFGEIPSARDFTKRYDGHQYTQEEVTQNMKRIEIFRTKYWKVPELTV